MEEIVSMIKSCIVINKGGLPLKDLNSNYKELVGHSIPYNKFNYASLEELVLNIPEVHTKYGSDGLILTIRDPKLAHISDLVAKQRSVVKNKKPPGRLQQNSSVSYKIRPKVPAPSLKVPNTGINEVKSMIKSCIVKFKGGLSLEDLNTNYKTLVGESIPYQKYGYDSLEELVYNIPEINIIDTRYGHILMISDPKLAHVSDLVTKQRNEAQNKKSPGQLLQKSSVSYKIRPKVPATSLKVSNSGINEVKAMIKSCIVISKGGMSLEGLDKNYKDLTGESIPYRKYNYASLEELVHNIPEIHITDSWDGQILTISDPKLAHISDLVAKQKGVTNKKQPKKSLSNSCVIHQNQPKVAAPSSITKQGQPNKHLPSTTIKQAQPNMNVVSEQTLNQEMDYTISTMKSLLVINNGKLYLEDLYYNYRDLVGDFIPYKKFKFDSLEKFVSSIPGIQISQDKCGQVLILKDPKYTHLHKPIAKPNCETNEKTLNQEMDYTMYMIKAVLLINKGQLYLEDLYYSYHNFVGDFIRYLKFKFSSLEEFVSSIPGIQISQDKRGKLLTLKGPKLTDLPKPKRKEKKKKLPVNSPPTISFSQKEQPELKKQEKNDTISMIKACMELNEGGLLMEDLNYYYEDLVGELIAYKKFGYKTLVEFLCDIPEIFISQRRNGYFLTLDDSVIAQKAKKKPHDDSCVSTQGSLPNTNDKGHLNPEKCLLRDCSGPERDVRDLMYKNGMISVTIKNDLCVKRTGETVCQPTDCLTMSSWRKSKDSSKGKNSILPISREHQSEEFNLFTTSSPTRRTAQSLSVDKPNLFVEIENDAQNRTARQLHPRYDDGLNAEDISCSTS